MSKSKSHKIEVGKSRPTENRASNALTQRHVNLWYQKVVEARKNVDDVGDQIKAVANVLFDLSECIKRGEEDVDVIVQLTQKENMKASLAILAERLKTSPIFQNEVS
jgi:hypothetical protein